MRIFVCLLEFWESELSAFVGSDVGLDQVVYSRCTYRPDAPMLLSQSIYDAAESLPNMSVYFGMSGCLSMGGTYGVNQVSAVETDLLCSVVAMGF